MATRVRPALPLERLRLSGHLVDVGPAELRLHRREIVHVLRAAWGRSPRPAEIEFADTVVAGWPAPLQLWQAGVRCQGDLAAPLQPGQPLHDYLHEEFVRTLDPTQMKAFGTDLGWLAGPGPLVSRATNPSRRAVADRIVRDRIAVVPGPAGWELHPLAGAFVEMHVARPRTSGAGARTGAGAERPVPRAGHAGPSVAIRTLGGLQVMVGGFSIERAALPTSVRRLLELLLCLPGYQATAHQAARLLWPHHLERSALNSFNVALHGLRRLLEPELTARSQSRYVLRHGRTYRLCLERIAADVEEFCQLVRQGQSSRAVPASEQLEAAVALYRGDFLASSSEDYARQRRVQLRRVALDVLDRLGAWHSAGGDGARALRIYERLLELEPHREDVWGRVLELHVAAGDEHQALAALQRCEQTLGEAGIEPSALLKELHRRIREERPRSRRRPLTA